MTPCSSCPLGMLCLETGFDAQIPFCTKCGHAILIDCRRADTETAVDWFTNVRTRDWAFMIAGGRNHWNEATPRQLCALVSRVERGVPKNCPTTRSVIGVHTAYPCPTRKP
jgi:hypothetical protein